MPMSFHAKRRDKLTRLLKKSGADACLITNPINVTYLTGFSGDSTYLLLAPKLALLLSDTRYEEQLGEESPDIEARIRDSSLSMNALLSRELKSAKVNSLALESASLSYHNWQSLATVLESIDLVPTENWVEDLRAIKDKQELEEIRRSIHLAERSFQVIRASLRGEQTERQIAHNLEHQIRTFGGVKCAFEPIVGVGSRAALPHAIPTERTISESPFVLIDWGARAGLYTSDLTRVLVTGKTNAKFAKIYQTVLEAQLAAIQAIRPGVKASEVDRAARKVIEDAGFGKNFGHGLGHGFGLEIHEQPRMSPMNPAELQAGMVITVEPGIYLAGWGGVRIEDDILVTSDGHEVLTSVPKQLDECYVAL